jgi:hypothetical protein
MCPLAALADFSNVLFQIIGFKRFAIDQIVHTPHSNAKIPNLGGKFNLAHQVSVLFTVVQLILVSFNNQTHE